MKYLIIISLFCGSLYAQDTLPGHGIVFDSLGGELISFSPCQHGWGEDSLYPHHYRPLEFFKDCTVVTFPPPDSGIGWELEHEVVWINGVEYIPDESSKTAFFALIALGIIATLGAVLIYRF